MPPAPKPTGRQFRKTLSEPRWRGLRPKRRLRKRRQRISQPRRRIPRRNIRRSCPNVTACWPLSPNGLDSLASPVLPRINIWAHRRIPPMDTAMDHAQLLISGKQTKPWFIRRKSTLPATISCALKSSLRRKISVRYITVIGDYLVGFDFWGSPSAKWPRISEHHQDRQVQITIPRASFEAFSSAVRSAGILAPSAPSGVLEAVSELEQRGFAPGPAEERNSYRQPEHVACSDVNVRISRHRGRIELPPPK